MKKPPLPIFGIVLLDIFAAISSFFVVDQIGILGASIEFLLFAALAAGLWQLKKWAWVVEIVISSLQIAVLLLGVVIALFTSTMLETRKDVSTAELLAVLTALILVNALVVAVLTVPKIKAEFH